MQYFIKSACAALALAFLCTCQPAVQAGKPVSKQVHKKPILRSDRNRKLQPNQWKRKLIVAKMDKQKICNLTTAITIPPSDEMLKIPKHVPKLEGCTVAKTPPSLDFVIVPLDPRFLYLKNEKDPGGGLWTVWGQGIYYPKNKKLYGAIGNHVFYDSRLHIFEYDPATKKVRTFQELNDAAGLPIEYGDGKIHGSLGFFNGPNLYFCTYWCEYPEPKDWEYKEGYQGSRIMSFNVDTHKVTDLGVPLRHVSWQYHHMDCQRGLMYAVGGPTQEFLCYDLKNKKMLYGGCLPAGMEWAGRCMMVDEKTGCVYSSNNVEKDPVHMIKYDSATNHFTKMKCSGPLVALGKNDSNDANQIRATTSRRAKDGWFMCVTKYGHIFKFYPDQDRIDDMGMCWAAEPSKLYTTTLAISPDDKYVYYIPDAHGGAQDLGAVVVQFNTQTGEKKALAFLFPFLYDKYGYISGGAFSLSMNETGSDLFVHMNGTFYEYNPKGCETFGDPSVIVVHIPKSERP